MKRFLRLALVSIIITAMHQTAVSQSVSINTTGTVADPSAMLDITSTTKGVLVTRMDKTAKNLIAAPANGLLVYQTGPDSIGFHYYDQPNTRWVFINASGFATDTVAWRTKGNTGLADTSSFFGNRDNIPLNFRQNNIKTGRIDNINGNVFFGNSAGNDTAVGYVNIGNFAGSNLNNALPGVNIGSRAGLDATSANANSVNIGVRAGQSVPANTSTQNVYIGAAAGQSNKAGGGNVGIGQQALRFDTTGGINTAVGYLSMTNAGNGGGNSALGGYSLQNHKTGDLNTAIGYESMQLDSAGSINVAIGWRALRSNKTGTENTAVGVGALESDSTGSWNTAVGRYAGFLNKRGNFNTAMGMQSAVTSDTANYTTMIGYQAGYYNRSNYNTGIGAFALTQNNFTTGAATTGIENTGIGYGAGFNINLGSQNTAIGHQAMRGVSAYISGDRNVAVGDSAMTNLSSGFNNTAIGAFALRHDSSGSYNVAIGYRAADSARNASALIAIGADALRFNKADSNIAIGYRAGRTLGSNTAWVPTEATFLGNWAGDGAFVSSKNTAVGFRALAQRAPNGNATDYNGGGRNTAIGDSAMANSVGISNVVIGAQALPNAGVGVFNNVAIGDSAMGDASLVNDNVAIGYHSLKSSNYASTANTGNTATGAYSGGKITSGYYNTINGYYAAENATTAAGVTAIGTSSFRTNVSGFDNVGVGINTGFHVTSGANTYLGSYAGEGAAGFSTGASNTGAGYFALSDIRSGFNNTAVGRQALAADTSGSYNVAIGQFALLNNLASDFNTAVGYNSLLLHKRAGFTYNTGLGSFALEQDSSGFQNTGVGTSAFRFNKTGFLNTGVGINAGYFQKESYNTFIGALSGFGERSPSTNYAADTGKYNSGLGALALYRIAQGSNNVAMGYSAMYSDSSGNLNTAVGNGALYSNTQSNVNQAYGWNALYSYNGGAGDTYNNAFGDLAMENLATGTQNVAMGSWAMRSHISGSRNTAIGNLAMGSTGISGSFNTAIGDNALLITNADGNTGIGRNAGNTNTTGTNNTLIGYDADVTTATQTYATAIGSGATVACSNCLVLGGNTATNRTKVGINKSLPTFFLDLAHPTGIGNGLGIQNTSEPFGWELYQSATSNFFFNYNGANVATINSATGAYTVTSDRRLKTNIKPMESILDRVMKLTPSRYQYIRNNPSQIQTIGLIAQDVAPLFPEFVSKQKSDEKNPQFTEVYGLDYAGLSVVAIKAIQEQQNQIEKVVVENEELKKKNQQLEKDIQAIKAKLGINN